MNSKVILITGGTSGIGKAIAERFAKEGLKVAIIGRTIEKLEQTKRELESAYSVEILPIQLDVRDYPKVEEMVKLVDKQFGHIDALINNAAGNFICPAEKLTVNGWNSVIDIVLNGTFYCSSVVGNYWIKNKQKGNILNIVATYAWDAAPGVIHSAAAKAGVLSMTKTLAVEWGGQYGIRVNAIAPGPIERTGGADKLLLSTEAANNTLQSIPLKRFGTPEEIAGLASYILSDEASYLNGECITMDGGQSLRQFPF
ncbi:2,4-dienoyl-CoA reductase [Metabacillus malikii]|uniref:NAD(P)-dependent dehydrogenase (Short-subunit alcohol dehydrogenase family) n=1 Tax=Metabacillus malikii TaxID=1504265 RepID=A0ABT9ZBZ5_9BACI|nr:2,4-dienoyl-CoA reductase [Metabacillus malikii]MDQ0229530.1 NAD(P)-dependent dehydrogenase (short-subunit alcohol dehydrogenase family) [Metabacillus malikii]